MQALGRAETKEREDVMSKDDRIFIEDAAKDVGSTPVRLLMLIKQGVIRGELQGGQWYVDREVLEGFAKADGDNRPILACAASCKASSCGCR